MEFFFCQLNFWFEIDQVLIGCNFKVILWISRWLWNGTHRYFLKAVSIDSTSISPWLARIFFIFESMSKTLLMYRQPVYHWKPGILWKWAESEGAFFGVHFLYEVLCGPWCANWADFCFNLFTIGWTFMWIHSMIPWWLLKPMAPWKRNFGSPDETLEAPTEHWKNFLNKHTQQWHGRTTVYQWLRASIDRVTTCPNVFSIHMSILSAVHRGFLVATLRGAAPSRQCEPHDCERAARRTLTSFGHKHWKTGRDGQGLCGRETFTRVTEPGIGLGEKNHKLPKFRFFPETLRCYFTVLPANHGHGSHRVSSIYIYIYI